MLRYLLISFFFLLSPAIFAQAGNDTFQLYFDLGNPELNQEARAKLDSLLYYDAIHSNTRLVIVGYADYIGDEERNKKLSEHRSEHVLNYLLSMGLPKGNVRRCIGKGEVSRKVEFASGSPEDRRVDLVIDRIAMRQIQAADPEPVVAGNAPPKRPPTASAAPNTPSADHSSNLDLSNVEVGQTIVLDKIYFHSGRHYVKDESLPELEKLYKVLVANPELKIQIEGHVCCVNAIDALDEDTFELALSVNRAKFIYQYLIRKGIDRRRLFFRGFGRSRPAVAKERTVEDENKNRRVEIRILE